MTVGLSHEEANAKIAQINEHLANVHQLLTNAHQTQLDMVGGGGPWVGHSATAYRNTAEAQHEHFTGVLQNLQHIVETGSNHMRSIATADGN